MERGSAADLLNPSVFRGAAENRSGAVARWRAVGEAAEQPVLEADDNVGEPVVWQSHGFYWMLHTARLADETRRLRLARSEDGVRWTKLAAEFGAAQAWDAKVVCDSSVVVDGDRVLVWFGGGEPAGPDENIHGQIGFGVLRPVSATLEK